MRQCRLISAENWRRLTEQLAADEFVEVPATQDVCIQCEVGIFHTVSLSRPFLGLETKTETLDFKSRDQDLGLQVSKPGPRPSWTFSTEHERIL